MTLTADRPAARESALDKAVARARGQFRASTADHAMEVLLDTTPAGGVHRHLRFARPGTGIWRFDLVTYPGHLVVSGDIGCIVMRTAYDMLGFVTHRAGRPHPSYWAEKVVTGTARTGFSTDEFAEQMREHLDDLALDHDPRDHQAITAAADRALLANLYDDVEQVRYDLDGLHIDLPSGDAFDLGDSFDINERDFSGLDHHYLLACHAAAWGARRYLDAGGVLATEPKGPTR